MAGVVDCWGADLDGNTVVPPSLGTVVALAAGWAFSCAVEDTGAVVCWGHNSEGQTNVPPGLLL